MMMRTTAPAIKTMGFDVRLPKAPPKIEPVADPAPVPTLPMALPAP